MDFSKNKQLEYIDKIIEVCFICLVFILPVAHTMTIRSIFIYLPAILWVYKMILKKEVLFIRNQMTLPLIIFSVIAALSLLTAVNPGYALRELQGEMITDFLLFFLLLNNVRNMKQVNRIILSLLFGSLVQGIYSVFTYFSQNGNWLESLLDYNIKAWGLTAGYISYSVFLITIIPFIFYKIMTSAGQKRFMFILLLLLNLFMLYLTHQRGALVALFVQVFIFFWFVKRRMAYLVIGIAALAIFIMPSNLLYHGTDVVDLKTEETVNYENTINSRIALWKFTVREIAGHPFSGIGFGRHSFSAKYNQFRGTDLWHSLNTFLNITIQLGIQGLLAFIFILYRLTKTYVSGLKESRGEAYYFFLASLMCIAGFFIRNMFDDHYVDDNGQMFWVLTGLALAVFIQIKKLAYNRTSFLSKKEGQTEQGI
ncbi:MAG TPA: O-antigen ligase domain-containing protein [Nitrospirae bacterium]|nr:O-Antigen ligase [bacterium BMS3Abin06]HDH12372.1 O-antigen ligase domain-containing protein [Nitrospirota bacterium]HDZ01254.1 O-antigen ligase domain-containing protein [Nitrospirota bacterium]